jgi:DNA-binding SARP family transcriptional activator/tetratricopeptide (TPR) repeat protein
LVLFDQADGAVLVPGTRLRVLLAALLLRANTPVPAEVLADAVWDGEPSPAAVATLRSHVKRLRRVLGPEIGRRIVAHERGYLIRVEPLELDLVEFEALCRAAGSALREGAWEQAADAAGRTARLWRGTPLLNVPSQVLCDQVVPRLEQLRVQVVEDRVEADLRLGRCEGLVAELRDLTASHPLRERFHAQLITALARAGRQAEALEAYRSARTALVDELGVEPGAELRALHERILAGDGIAWGTPDPAPVAKASPVPVSQVSVPRQLPAAARHFTGRSAERDALAGLPELSWHARGGGSAAAISAIDGMAGIGMAALAVHAAHALAEKYPDGQLFIDLYGYTEGYAPRTAGDALAVLLGALGVPRRQLPRDLGERAALYRHRLAGTRTLILFDNAASEAQVRPLVPGSAQCLVLVTSRRRLKGLDDAHHLALEPLSEADALELVRAVVGPERAAAGEPALVEIARLCGKLPLALRIAAALLRHRRAWSLGRLAGLLRDQRQRLDALSDGERGLEAVLALSYAALTHSQRHMFRQLGLVPGADVNAQAAAALIDAAPATATGLLEGLVDHNLLDQPAPGRYQLHDLVRLYAGALALRDPDGESDGALARLLDYYEHCANSADALITLYPSPRPNDGARPYASTPADPAAAWAWLRAERANLLAAARHAAARADHALTAALTAGFATLLRVDGSWSEAAEFQSAAIDAARELGDHPAHAGALLNLGDARAGLGDYSGAAGDLRRALELYRELGERRGQATALTWLGAAQSASGDYQSAVEMLREGLRLYRELGEWRGQANALTRLANACVQVGDNPGADRVLQEALGLYRELGERREQADVLALLEELKRMTEDDPDTGRARRTGSAYPGGVRALEGYTGAITAVATPRQHLDLRPDGLHVTGEAWRPGAGDARAAPGSSELAAELFEGVAAACGEDRALTRLAREES